MFLRPNLYTSYESESEILPTYTKKVMAAIGILILFLIPFDIPNAGRAQLTIWDIRGRLVKSLVDSEVAPGRYQPVWDGRDDNGRRVAAGIYFVRLQSGKFSASGKVVRLR